MKKNNDYKLEEFVEQKILEHPLEMKDIVSIVSNAWEGILASEVGNSRSKIGIDLFPKPQFVGFLLHELIPREANLMFPDLWRVDEHKKDKDMVYLPNDQFSIEIKTSSSQKGIYGNRSYTKSPGVDKSKEGYLLSINFDKITPQNKNPQINLIRFGYLKQSDWIGQEAESGQQASLRSETMKRKLLEIYRRER